MLTFSVAPIQLEEDINDGVHLDGPSVEQRRLIDPLPNSVESSLDQQRVSRDELQLHDGAIFTDDGVQSDHTFNARLPRCLRINGLNFVVDSGLLSTSP